MLTKEKKVAIAVGTLVLLLCGCLCLMILAIRVNTNLNTLTDRDSLKEEYYNYSSSSSSTSSTQAIINGPCSTITEPTIPRLATNDEGGAYSFIIDLNEVIQDFEFTCKSEFKDTYDPMFWKRPDGWYATDSVYTSFNFGLLYEYDGNTDVVEVLEDHESAASDIVSFLEDTFIENGFTPNALNTRYDPSKWDEYPTIFAETELAFEKGDFACKIIILPDQINWAYYGDYDYQNKSARWSYLVKVNCSDRLETQFNTQKPLLEALGDQNKAIYLIWNDDTVYSTQVVDPMTDSTALSTEMGIFKRSGETFEKIYVGLGSPPCELVDYQDLSEVYCHEDDYQYREAKP